jgi:hypothetical protein
MADWIPWPHIHRTPVFCAFSDGSAFLYVWTEKDHLRHAQPSPTVRLFLATGSGKVMVYGR